MPGNWESVLTVQQRITTLAQRSEEFTFFSLAHHITLYWLEAAYFRTRKDGAAGIDNVTGKEYERNLHENLQSLLDRLKSGTYKAPPVKRKHIPKGTSGETRPIGIPTFEDKIVQRAVVMLLEPIYEHDFYDGSFGFRPKRSAHQALEAVRNAAMEVRGGWILEVDIRKFFDNLNHKHLQEFVSRRVMAVIPKRFEKYGLTVHPDKTRLIDFRSPNHWERRREAKANDDEPGGTRVDTFDLLGFTHYWAKTQKGNWMILRKTMRSRLSRSIHEISQWCRFHRHLPVQEQWQKLCEKIRGHYAYFAIRGNSRSISSFFYWIKHAWQYWLSRRHRERSFTWTIFNRLLRKYPLPSPRVIPRSN